MCVRAPVCVQCVSVYYVNFFSLMQNMEFVVTFLQLNLSVLYMKFHFVCHRQH
jgi:hypothetical protein